MRTWVQVIRCAPWLSAYRAAARPAAGHPRRTVPPRSRGGAAPGPNCHVAAPPADAVPLLLRDVVNVDADEVRVLDPNQLPGPEVGHEDLLHGLPAVLQVREHA